MIGVAVVIVLVLAGVALRRAPLDVELATIDRGRVRPTVVDEARTRIPEVFIVSMPVTARLLRVSVEPGDLLNQGAPVARLVGLATGFLDPRGDAEARASLVAAEARQAAAILERDNLEREFLRVETLASAHLVADSVRDLALSRWRVAEASAQAAAAETKRARTVLTRAGTEGETSSVILRAPVAGVVLAVMQKSETALAAGTPLLSLGDPTRVDVVVELLSQEAVRVRVGDSATIENWGESTSAAPPLAAVVDRIEPVAYTKVSSLGIEEQRTRIVLKFGEPVPAPLRAHGYRVEARIVVDEAPDVARVPLGALFRVGEGWCVYVLQDGRAKRRAVTLGLRDERFAEVRDGLQRGEQVVLFPSSEVVEGVKLREQNPR